MSFLINLFEDAEAPASPSIIGSPYNVHHKVHVDFDLKWHGQEPTEMFEIYEKLGEGGYGAVYRARHKETGFTLAIKMIDLADEAEKIMHEIDILKKCRNPNIVSYYGSVVHERKLWILMDYCSLGSISDVLAECPPLNEDEIAHVCTEVLKGLAYLHASKIIHRDVKAANILLTNQAHVRIVDFGISAQIDKSEKLHEPVGSPFWMAPEVIMETEHSYKCDIWSLGITVLEMAEGAPPHSNIHPFRALFLIPKKPPPTFTDPSKWSPEVIDFVAQCLQKQPHERPSAIELLQHPFIAKKIQSPEVLRNTIISYLKAKKEKQMKLKREIAKLGRKPLANSGLSQASDASPPSSPRSSPRVLPSSPRSTRETNHSPTSPPSQVFDSAPIYLPDVEVIPSPDGIPDEKPDASDDNVDGFQTMFIHSMNITDGSVRSSLDLDSAEELSDSSTNTVEIKSLSPEITESQSPKLPSKSVNLSARSPNLPTKSPKLLSKSQSTQSSQSTRDLLTAGEFQILRQMIVDAKIEICRVREEVSSQNAVLKSELNDIKSQLSELTSLMLALHPNSHPPPPVTPGKKK